MNHLHFHPHPHHLPLQMMQQCQRIALTRVFLCLKNMQNEHIIILDEATSALDIATEEKVINNLLSLVDKKTTIIAIAHRYNILKKSDYIIT